MIDVVLFVVTNYIFAETCRYNNMKRINHILSQKRTPISKSFDSNKWFQFAQSRLSHMVANDPDSARRMISNLFGGRDVHQIGKNNLLMGLRTIMTSKEPFESLDTVSSETETIQAIIAPLGVGTDRETNFPFHRINNLVTNHGPTTPIFWPMGLSVLRSVIRNVVNLRLRFWGFRKDTTEVGLVFWNAVWDHSKPVMVFFHGYGLGVAPYMKMIRYFMDAKTFGGMALVEFPGISGHPIDIDSPQPYPTAQEIADHVRGYLDTMGRLEFCAMGHSYGSAVLANCMNYQPQMFRKTILYEAPVFFPNNTISWSYVFSPIYFSDMVKQLLRGKVLKAVNTMVFGHVYNQHVSRNVIYFYEFCLWRETIDSLVILSGKDNIVASYDIASYLKSRDFQGTVRFFPNHRHGQQIMNTKLYKSVVEWIACS